MFFFGFFVGVAVTAWFILKENGDRLIRLGGRMNGAARNFREWLDRTERFGM